MNEKVKQEVKELIKKLNLHCSIREFENKVNWDETSANYKLSEDFIREFKDKINWFWASCNQVLSKSFVSEFRDYLDIKSLLENGRISQEFYNKLTKPLTRFDMMII